MNLKPADCGQAGRGALATAAECCELRERVPRRIKPLAALFAAALLVTACWWLVDAGARAQLPKDDGPPAPLNSSLAAWRPPPWVDKSGEPTAHADGCPLGSQMDRSMPILKAWIDALNEANITFFATGSEACRALRVGSNTLRFRDTDLGISARPKHGDHDIDLFAVFPNQVRLSSTFSLAAHFSIHI